MSDPAMPPTAPPPAAPPTEREPVFTAPPVTVALCLTLLAVFGIIQILPEAWQWAVLHDLSVVPSRLVRALDDPLSEAGFWSVAALIGHAFLHFDTMHVLLNCGFLLAFGSACERLLGVGRFVALLIGSVLAGAAAQIGADWGREVLMYGASGGVSGCVGGVVRILKDAPRSVERQRFIIALTVAMVAGNLLFALFGSEILGGDAEIAWEAHLGGFVAGFLLAGRPR